MTDQRLRDLERDAAQGDLQAQVRLLVERVRVGDLTEERLWLAAYLGHEAARVAASDMASGPYEGTSEPILSLGWWGQRPCVLASIAAVRGAMALVGIDDVLVEGDLACAIRGEASPRDGHWATHAHPDRLVEALQRCSMRISSASVPHAAKWDGLLDYAVQKMLEMTFEELSSSGRWHQGLGERLSAMFPVPAELGGLGVWCAAVRSNVPRALIPWALASPGSSP